MAKREAPMLALADYLPEGTFPDVLNYLRQYKVHLTVARERKSLLGDYRHRTAAENHRISVNGNLNKFAFLITLLHELAHLLTFEQFGNRVQAHGQEWKAIYGQLLARFLSAHIFPDDIRSALLESLRNPAASTCAEDGLLRVLRRYDPAQTGRVLVEEIPLNGLFQIDDGRIFKKEARLRKRFKCTEVGTGKVYLFSPVFEVKQLPNQ